MKHLKNFESYSSSKVDELLDKISKEGIDSLTDEEKEILKNNGIMPGKEEKNSISSDNNEDDEDDEEYYSKSDLSTMMEGDFDEKEVGADWLARREKARELYDFKYFTTNRPADIFLQYEDIMEYLEDDKNAPGFKEKIVKYFINNLNHIEGKTKDERLIRTLQAMEISLSEELDKHI